MIVPRLDKAEFEASDAVEKAVAETRQHAQKLIESQALSAGPGKGKAATGDPNKPDSSLLEQGGESTESTWAKMSGKI